MGTMSGSTARRDGHPRGLTRAGLEDLLSPLLPPQCRDRLWAETWDDAGVSPVTLWSWCRTYGVDVAALAVAGRLTELQLRVHLSDARTPNRGVLEMLADLNCFPYLTPAARPVLADLAAAGA
jgi:hypothetical protein